MLEPSKPARFEPEIQKKIDAIELADKLQNVAEAARRADVSRETSYKNRKILAEKGPLALKRTFNKKHRHKNRAAPSIEGKVIQFSLENTHLGQAQVALQLKKFHHIDISSGGVRNIWLREKIQTLALRVRRNNSNSSSSFCYAPTTKSLGN